MKGRSQSIPTCRWHDHSAKRPKYYIKKLLDIINSFSQLVRCKIKLQKSVAVLYQQWWDWGGVKGKQLHL
jgi:hypothetical protein